MATSSTPVLRPLGVFALAGLLAAAGATAQGVAISEAGIAVGADPVLTEAAGVPLYARGSGLFRPANRLVRLGSKVLVDDVCDGSQPAKRGLTLTVLEAVPPHDLVTSENYDTWGSTDAANQLATALANLDPIWIGILTSCDAFEAHMTAELRDVAAQLGLAQLAASYPGSLTIGSTWRHPYAAVFHGAEGGENRKVLEILQPNAFLAPYAVAATWLIGDGFVGQSFSPVAVRRGADPPCGDATGNVWVDCGNGTVTHNPTGLVWLANANCWGDLTWEHALATVAGLSDIAGSDPADCGLSDGSLPDDWRLPSLQDWQAMIIAASIASCSVPVTSDDGSSCWNGSPESSFTGVVTLGYWSTTTDATEPANAFGAIGSTIDLFAKSNSAYVWPVRDGR